MVILVVSTAGKLRLHRWSVLVRYTPWNSSLWTIHMTKASHWLSPHTTVLQTHRPMRCDPTSLCNWSVRKCRVPPVQLYNPRHPGPAHAAPHAPLRVRLKTTLRSRNLTNRAELHVGGLQRIPPRGRSWMDRWGVVTRRRIVVGANNLALISMIGIAHR